MMSERKSVTIKCILALMTVLAGASACGRNPGLVYDTAEAREWRTLASRDSFVIDSLSRLINTDSFYRLNEAMRTASAPESLMQESACERARLMFRHGVRPLEMAMHRMFDTLWRPDPKRVEREIWTRMPAYGAVSVSDSLCNDYGPRAPDSVSGVSLDYPRFRPPPAGLSR